MAHKRILIVFFVCLMINTVGCSMFYVNKDHNGGRSTDSNKPGIKNQTGSAVKPGQNGEEGKTEPGSPAQENKTQANPEKDAEQPVIVKTTTDASHEELKATYEEIDRELNSLINELEKPDTPIDSSLDLEP